MHKKTTERKLFPLPIQKTYNLNIVSYNPGLPFCHFPPSDNYAVQDGITAAEILALSNNIAKQ